MRSAVPSLRSYRLGSWLTDCIFMFLMSTTIGIAVGAPTVEVSRMVWVAAVVGGAVVVMFRPRSSDLTADLTCLGGVRLRNW